MKLINRAESKNKFHHTIGKICMENGFCRKNNIYYRVHGDQIFQIVTFIKHYDSIQVRINIKPLYSRWQATMNGDKKIMYLAEFPLDVIGVTCYDLNVGYYQLEFMDDRLISFFLQKFINVLNCTQNANNLYLQRNILSFIYDEECDCEKHSYDSIVKLIQNREVTVDKDAIYSLLKNEKYKEAKASIEYRCEYFENDTNELDLIGIKKHIDYSEYSEIISILKNNYSQNASYLKLVFGIVI